MARPGASACLAQPAASSSGPDLSSAGPGSQVTRHSWTAAAAGEASHVVVDGAIDAAIDTARAQWPGRWRLRQSGRKRFVGCRGRCVVAVGAPRTPPARSWPACRKRRIWVVRHSRRYSAAGSPRPARLVLDPGALRRLDRVKVVVIDGAALRGDARAVLQARGGAPGWDHDRVYEVADALLHGEQAPEPDPDELPATGARLRWVRAQGPSTAPAQGLEHADLVVDGEYGWQRRGRMGSRPFRDSASADRAPDRRPGGPAARCWHPGSGRQRRRDSSIRHTAAQVGPRTAGRSRAGNTDNRPSPRLRVDGHIGGAGDRRRRRSARRSPAATPWTADIITGTDLAAAVRILSALPVARQASESAVSLAKGGTTFAGLLLVTGDPRRRPAHLPCDAGSIRSTRPPQPLWPRELSRPPTCYDNQIPPRNR